MEQSAHEEGARSGAVPWAPRRRWAGATSPVGWWVARGAWQLRLQGSAAERNTRVGGTPCPRLVPHTNPGGAPYLITGWHLTVERRLGDRQHVGCAVQYPLSLPYSSHNSGGSSLPPYWARTPTVGYRAPMRRPSSCRTCGSTTPVPALFITQIRGELPTSLLGENSNSRLQSADEATVNTSDVRSNTPCPCLVHHTNPGGVSYLLAGWELQQ